MEYHFANHSSSFCTYLFFILYFGSTLFSVRLHRIMLAIEVAATLSVHLPFIPCIISWCIPVWVLLCLSSDEVLQCWRKLGRTLKTSVSLALFDVYYQLSALVYNQSTKKSKTAARVVATCAHALTLRQSLDERIIEAMLDTVNKCDAAGLMRYLSDIWQQFVTDGLRLGSIPLCSMFTTFQYVETICYSLVVVS